MVGESDNVSFGVSVKDETSSKGLGLQESAKQVNENEGLRNEEQDGLDFSQQKEQIELGTEKGGQES